MDKTQAVQASMQKPVPPPDASEYDARRIAHWDKVAASKGSSRSLGSYYHLRLAEIYKSLVTPDQKILEIGCGEGDLLAALNPLVGVGIDFSEAMIARAEAKHKSLRFFKMNAHDMGLDEGFDVIILSDLVNDLRDVQGVFEEIRPLCMPYTRIILNFYSHLWEPPLKLSQQLGFATPTLPQNWLTNEDVLNLLLLSDFEVVRRWTEVLLPLSVPILSSFSNRYLTRLWPFKYFPITNLVVARPRIQCNKDQKPSVSVVVPARNEEGNIGQILSRVPMMGSVDRVDFCGRSLDR